MIDSAFACGQCGAELPATDGVEACQCPNCGADQQPTSLSDVALDATSERPAQRVWEDAARIPLTEDAVLDLLRQHFAEVDSILMHPYVPPLKEHAARSAHASHLPPRERILALYATHVLDASVHEGFIVTPSRICWKNPGERPCFLRWSDLDPDHLYLDGGRLFLGDEAIALTEPEVQDACANAFHVLALSGLRRHPISGAVPARDTRPKLHAFESDHSELLSTPRSATPPPAHTLSYVAYASHAQTQRPDHACWYCHTPLYETTPQCAFCGAEPMSTGWLRTA